MISFNVLMFQTMSFVFRFIGQLYRKQLLSSKIVNWCLYELIKDTHKVGDSYPEPPFDEVSYN